MANNELNLLPCPMCGGAAKFECEEQGFAAYINVGCTKCFAKGPVTRFHIYYNGLTDTENGREYDPAPEYKAKAAEAWNRRAAPAQGGLSDALPELIQLVRGIRPEYGAVGSRDVDVSRQQKQIDSAISLMCREQHAMQASRATRVGELSDAEIDDMAFGYAPSGQIGELRDLIKAVQSKVRGQQGGVSDTARLDFVLTHGGPMQRDGKFRCFGHADCGWMDSPRAAIDCARSRIAAIQAQAGEGAAT